ncbi:N-terminal kinase-like protein [Smittium culicis]|uniref:N-terminal kinase-like protein n=1 Tax=Smittium culicis TaxID=133412 RepID=A0A1R1YFL0_9FUNG|nr:N-terminal kinase-like protein [Smittium culicis]
MDNKLPVSIFIFKKDGNNSKLEAAQNALKRIKTLRHPDFLQYFDSAETSEAIYIATELVKPLINMSFSGVNSDSIVWGLFKLCRGIKFLNEDCKLIHGNIQLASIFVARSGDWKIFGFELLDSLDEPRPKFMNPNSLGYKYSEISSPEVKANNLSIIEQSNIGIIDSYQIGLFLSELSKNPDAKSDYDRSATTKNLIRNLLSSDPKFRIPISAFIERSLKANGMFVTSFVKNNIFVEELSTKDKPEIANFLNDLNNDFETYPKETIKIKFLPELIKIMGFGGDALTLSTILKISKLMSPEEYSEIMTPAIIGFYSSNDRMLRYNLLKQLPEYLNNLSHETVIKSIFPNYLPEKIVNGDMIRNLTRLISDPEPGIRANSLICIGKATKHLTEYSMKNMVTPALVTSLRDPFPPSRIASIKTIIASCSYFDPIDSAKKILPNICLLLVDPEKSVRDISSKAIVALMASVEEYSKTMPETTAVQKFAQKTTSDQQNSRNSTQQQTSDSKGGWIMSSLASGISGALTYTTSLSKPTDKPVAETDKKESTASAGISRSNSEVGAASNINQSQSTQRPIIPKSSDSKTTNLNTAYNDWGNEEVNGWGEGDDDIDFGNIHNDDCDWGQNDSFSPSNSAMSNNFGKKPLSSNKNSLDESFNSLHISALKNNLPNNNSVDSLSDYKKNGSTNDWDADPSDWEFNFKSNPENGANSPKTFSDGIKTDIFSHSNSSIDSFKPSQSPKIVSSLKTSKLLNKVNHCPL